MNTNEEKIAALELRVAALEGRAVAATAAGRCAGGTGHGTARRRRGSLLNI